MSTTSIGSSSRPEAARERVAERLRALGVRPSRGLGQSFLLDPFVADAEAALVEAPPGAAVAEIGPGLGALTEALLRRGIGPLTAVERDPRLARGLRKELGDRVVVREADALEVDLSPFGVVVGNLPFRVATPLLLHALRSGVPRIVALVQEEVAQRLLASPGSGAYGRLTLLVGLYAEVEGFRIVPSRAFEPAPAVDGRIVVLRKRSGPPPVPDEPAFEELTRRLFSSRRKQLKNLLPRSIPPGRSAREVAGSAGWPADWETRRPEELPPEAYHAMARVLAGLGGVPSTGPEPPGGTRLPRPRSR